MFGKPGVTGNKDPIGRAAESALDVGLHGDRIELGQVKILASYPLQFLRLQSRLIRPGVRVLGVDA